MCTQLDGIYSDDVSDFADDEKIDVSKIKVSQPGLQLVAVLGEFRAADRLVSAWAQCCTDYFVCDFEVTFIDGFVFSGRYESWRKSRSRPPLSAYIKMQLNAFMTGKRDCPIFIESRSWDDPFPGMLTIDTFLEKYAIEPL
ncbi:hypothetical protein [Undibacterium terreum]|uniref:Uncharacterized protein n=1 Tax=Undibacterium terreum TaxID=1224302 RepID=A0A916UBC5_9BURK|nr:hypothetical protein [Undibacterium terreum]GGC66787.1 hypothetical protein GCM10011396_12280 [Undibacterium terreum]